MHIMVASPGPLTDEVYRNAFTFSTCSIAEMQDFLAILTQCVTYLLTYLSTYVLVVKKTENSENWKVL